MQELQRISSRDFTSYEHPRWLHAPLEKGFPWSSPLNRSSDKPKSQMEEQWGQSDETQSLFFSLFLSLSFFVYHHNWQDKESDQDVWAAAGWLVGTLMTTSHGSWTSKNKDDYCPRRLISLMFKVVDVCVNGTIALFSYNFANRVSLWSTRSAWTVI